MAPHDHDPVLVTGCSTGIGRAAAEALLARGHTVWATARRPETLADLAAKGAHVTALDVTDEASMTAAVAEVEAAHGAVGTLVNNAGYGEYGAVEEVARPTSSAWPGCASSCCRACGAPAAAGSSTSARWAGG